MYWNIPSSVSMQPHSILASQENPLAASGSPATEEPSSRGDKWLVPNEDQNSSIKLEILQSPMNAKVAVGKEKGRKPIDPPTVLKLVDNRPNEAKLLHPSPFYFVVCDLVTEDEKEVTKESQPLANALIGTRTSSINHSSESNPWEQGFFVFGDLGVKLEGKFRLRFNLFERDYTSTVPSIYHVTKLTSNVFTVFSHREFPGMAESTPLTQWLVEQGVKLRRRKDSQAVTTTKRNRKTADDCRRRNLKRRELGRPSSMERSMSGSSYTLSPASAPAPRSAASSSQPQALASAPPSNSSVDYTNNHYMGDMSGPSSSPSLHTASSGFMEFGDGSMGMSGAGPSQSLPTSNGFLGFGDAATHPSGYLEFQGSPYMGGGLGTARVIPSVSNGLMDSGFMDYGSTPYTQSPLLSTSGSGSTDMHGSFVPSSGGGEYLQTDHLPKQRENWWLRNQDTFGFSQS